MTLHCIKLFIPYFKSALNCLTPQNLFCGFVQSFLDMKVRLKMVPIFAIYL